MNPVKKTTQVSREFARQIAILTPLLGYGLALLLFALLALSSILAGQPLGEFVRESGGVFVSVTQSLGAFWVFGAFFAAIAAFGWWCLAMANVRGPGLALLSLAFRWATRAASLGKSRTVDVTVSRFALPGGFPLIAFPNRVTLLTPSGLTGAAPLLE